MTIHLIYASTSGNVERVMEMVAQTLKNRDIKSILSRAEKTKADIIKKNSKFIFGTSTWEHGRLNPFFKNLFEDMQKLNFHDKQAAFVGLGDTRYEPVLFCEGMEKLRDLWLKNGGEELATPLKIEGEPYEKLYSVVEPWADLLTKTLKFYDD